MRMGLFYGKFGIHVINAFPGTQIYFVHDFIILRITYIRTGSVGAGPGKYDIMQCHCKNQKTDSYYFPDQLKSPPYSSKYVRDGFTSSFRLCCRSFHRICCWFLAARHNSDNSAPVQHRLLPMHFVRLPVQHRPLPMRLVLLSGE